jgi:hypothetical protein
MHGAPIFGVAALGAAPASSDLHVTKQGAQFFEQQIRPLLARNCPTAAAAAISA